MRQHELFDGGGESVEAAVAEARVVRPVSAELRLGRYQDVLADVECDALIVDAPYSEKTHAGHDSGTRSVNAEPGEPRDNRQRQRQGLEPVRQELAYAFWTAEDVRAFVEFFAPRTRGWFVTITDNVLAPIWAAELERIGRYAFSPLAFVAPGSRVRLSGDGPAQWSCWIMVARPRCAPFHTWGALPGAYVVPAQQNNRKDADKARVTGGKPLWLMRSLVRDYSRPGDLICDPCAGAGTTLLAARIEGRSAIGAEMDEKHFAIAQRRLARGYTPTLFPELP